MEKKHGGPPFYNISKPSHVCFYYDVNLKKFLSSAWHPPLPWILVNMSSAGSLRNRAMAVSVVSALGQRCVLSIVAMEVLAFGCCCA